MATAHISHEDAFAIAEASHEIGFERLLISHVLYTTTTYSLEEQLRFLRLGALLEYCYSTFTTKKTTYERTLELIRALVRKIALLALTWVCRMENTRISE